MTSDTTAKTPSAAARAEAAAWIARLHGPNRTAEVVAGLRQWLADDPEHAQAFELLTDTWEKSGLLRRRPSEVIANLRRPRVWLSPSRAAAAVLLVAVLAAVTASFYWGADGVRTGLGEQRTLALEDGTRIYLNTSSYAIVRYDRHTRRVELEQGEALFEVAKHPDWPFIVTAGDRQVRALGTSFVVRRDAEQLAVTLVEGKVTVSAAGTLPGAAPASLDAATNASPTRQPHEARIDQGGASAQSAGTYTLAPGQRLTFATHLPPQLDRPSIDSVTAWQRGQVYLDDTPLEAAVAEMNRYSRRQIRIETRAAQDIRVSGIFRAGDFDDFARALASAYGLRITNQDTQIILSDPSPPDR